MFVASPSLSLFMWVESSWTKSCNNFFLQLYLCDVITNNNRGEQQQTNSFIRYVGKTWRIVSFYYYNVKLWEIFIIIFFVLFFCSFSLILFHAV